MKLIDNVVVLPVVTRLPLPVERLLKAAGDALLQDVIIIGHKADEVFWFASSEPDGPSVLWALEAAKQRLLNTTIEKEEE